MKNKKTKNIIIALVVGALATVTTSCERTASDEAVPATFSTNGDIFTDTPVGLGTFFYFPFAPDATNPVGSKYDAFSVDASESYAGTASIRFDVPSANDPDGNYAGGIFVIDGVGRDLTGYDALTFWAKASQGARIAQIGFGEDFGENKYRAVRQNIDFSTNWVKYTIPIPDPSKLVEERGMFSYAAAAPASGLGFTFWIDELRFEKLGTIAHPKPEIFDGQEISQRSFLGFEIVINGLSQTFNLANGINQSVSSAPGYFTFNSSNPQAATVNEIGVISLIGNGTAEITASILGVEARGSITIDVDGAFVTAPDPTRDPSNVISIFSDSYNNVAVDFFNGFWEPFQTTESSNFNAGGNNMISYSNFNFVGNQFANPTVDASAMTHLHLNMLIPNEIPADLDFLITVVDFGNDGVEGGGDDLREQLFFYADDFEADTWATLEVPLSLTRGHLGLIIYENINNPTTSEIDNFFLDNIYFFKQ
ncbi:MAG: hypothetical protein ACJA08_002910 [Cyclobacteriaceae bacterium]|jgi:hypothetical protein